MTAFVLDAGALVAVDRDDAAMMLRLRAALRRGVRIRTNAMVVAQVWRDARGRQARLAQLLRTVDVREVNQRTGRAAGELLAHSGTSDAVDATVALLAEDGDLILTSDPEDISKLLLVAQTGAEVVRC